MADESRPFVIAVQRPWKLWILPILAVLYFVAVLVLIGTDRRIKGVTNEMLVLAGVGLFALVILVELPFFLRRRAPKPVRAQPMPDAAAPVAASMNGRADDELLITSETQQGLQVLEYSAPAKSRNANTVYTKTYVPVSGAHVLRVETAVADAADI